MIFLLYLVIKELAANENITNRICGHDILEKKLDQLFIWVDAKKSFHSLLSLCVDKNRAWNNNYNTLKILVQTMQPYITLDKTSGEIHGYVGDMWNILADTLKLRFAIFKMPYRKGLQSIQKGLADIFLGAIVAEPEFKNVHISQPYLFNYYKLYLKIPKRDVGSYFYLQAFSYNLWLAALLMFGTMSITIWLSGKILKKINTKEPNVSITLCIIAAISGIINQGYDLGFRSNAMRIQIYVALLLGLILYSSMTAVIYSRMTIHKMQYPFTSLNNIAEKNFLSLCMRNDSFVYSSFTDDEGSLLPAWSNIVNNHNCLDIVDQSNIARVICQQNVVILESKIVFNAFVQREMKSLPCQVAPFEHRYFERGNVFLTSSNLQETRNISTMLTRMRSSGILNHVKVKQIKQIYQNSSNPWEQVKLTNIIGLIYLYTTMIILSLIILILEITIKSITSI